MTKPKPAELVGLYTQALRARCELLHALYGLSLATGAGVSDLEAAVNAAVLAGESIDKAAARLGSAHR